ncbi:MAG: hypothetical protein WC332_02205 [Clostridia bacterium]|jgi:hypothetical protein
MTKDELNNLIGKEGVMVIDRPTRKTPGMSINIVIKDVRISFGRTDLLVVPVSGTGERWTNLNKITLK